MTNISLTYFASKKLGLLTLCAAGTILAGCEDTGPSFLKPKPKVEGEGPAISNEAATEGAIEKEIERPDIFSADESALWDGRPSLGGIWVASPGVTDPERIIITNTENGRTVAGALFRRERSNPGPRLQLSSDAAEALGVLAGKPTKIKVVVVRTEVVQPEPVAVPETTESAEVAPLPAATAPERKPEEVVAEEEVVATGPSDAVVEAPLPEPEATGSPSSFGRSRAARTEAVEEVTIESEAVDTAPDQIVEITDGPSDPVVAVPEPELEGSPRSGLFSRRARVVEPIEDDAFVAPLDSTTSTAIETAPVTTTDLDPIAAASAAIERSEAEVETSIQLASSQSSPLARPYIQIGLYSKQANATATERRLSSAGVLPTVLKEKSAGASVWRVVVGPSRTSSERQDLHAKMRELGYEDAYFVTK